ncbi:hypothetical protein E2C01_015179 [Portunus trituberculatus]|uniref:Uncharacterized protein n=1 Tax=Portunus trituberculatus TaxID=210409 RepID=A0A5B7DM44_PORTR|nr:hypothetical protein [Portunus trituberculatus]
MRSFLYRECDAAPFRSRGGRRTGDHPRLLPCHVRHCGQHVPACTMPRYPHVREGDRWKAVTSITRSHVDTSPFSSLNSQS